MQKAIDKSQEIRTAGELGPGLVRFGLILAAFGALATLILFFVTGGGAERFFRSYLVNFAYFLSLALGALFFVLIQHLTSARWSVVVRRVAEILSGNLGLMAFLFIPVIFGMGHTYHHWLDPHAAEDPILAGKLGFLNQNFFLIRWAAYFIIWFLLSSFFYRKSVKQDSTGDLESTLAMKRASAPGIILFALTVSFAAFDLLMSINPHWFSTIFGVYYFAGGTLGAFALITISLLYLQSRNRLATSITTEHLHDMGKLVFAFVVFWAYIGFSQYMLIWYGNIPEETEWYLHRQTGSWTGFSWFILFGHFVFPFLGLISRAPKRVKGTLWIGAAWILFVHWFDIYWIAMPEWYPEGISFHLFDITLFLLLGGIYMAALGRRMTRSSLIPEKDPRLTESMAFENF